LNVWHLHEVAVSGALAIRLTRLEPRARKCCGALYLRGLLLREGRRKGGTGTGRKEK